METDPAQIDELIKLVGGVAIGWSHLEACLDICVHVVFTDWEASKTVPEKPRTALNRKLEFMRTVFVAGTLLDTLFPGVPEIMDEIEYLGRLRHQFIHGTTKFVFGTDGSATFERLMHTKLGLGSSSLTVKPDVMVEARNRMIQLALFMLDFAELLLKASPNAPNKTPREGSV